MVERIGQREHAAAREIERLRAALQELLDSGNQYAQAATAAEVAQENFTDPKSEISKLVKASVRASNAEKAALKLLEDAAVDAAIKEGK
jgi:hypothetical protein